MIGGKKVQSLDGCHPHTPMELLYVDTVSSRTRHNLRYDGDKMAIWLAYDTNLTVSNGNCHSEDRITVCSRRADTIRWRLSMLCFLSLILKDIATDVWSVARKAENREPDSAALGYASMSWGRTEWLETSWLYTDLAWGKHQAKILKWDILVFHSITRIGRVSQTQLVNILLYL